MIAASAIGIFVIPLLYATFQTWRESVSNKPGGGHGHMPKSQPEPPRQRTPEPAAAEPQ